MRTGLSLVLTMSIALAVSLHAGEVKVGAFTAALDQNNLLLPSSIRWSGGGGTELLDPAIGLNHTFTSFEFRNKFYHDENTNAWPGKSEPRFITDGLVLESAACEEGDYQGQRTLVSNTYARVERRLLFHKTAAAMRIVYRFEITREMMVHEPEMFAVVLRLAPGFTTWSVPDVRTAGAAPITADNVKQAEYALSFLAYGPALFHDPTNKVDLVASGALAGDLPDPMPARLVRLKKGQAFTFTLDLACFAGEPDKASAAFAEKCALLKPEQTPWVLVQDARALLDQKKVPEAEAALLKAAELNKEYATPYGNLAALRRDTKTTGDLNETEGWTEGAYRQPYNFGYILSGGRFHADPRLTVEQKRLAIFNMLMAVENTAFYPDYYVWAARPFEEMGMHVQACAMYRQALWALDRMPRPEEFKNKQRALFEKKIADLEKKMVEELSPDIAELTPVRAGQPLPATPAVIAPKAPVKAKAP